MFNNLCTSYYGVYKSLTKYWKCYGGLCCVLVSPYFHVAFFLTCLLYNPMTKPDNLSQWYLIVFSILPNVLGFTLGGYAFILGIGDDKFRDVLRGGTNGKISPFIEVNATFVHFIILQVIAIIMAVIGSQYAASNVFLNVFRFIAILIFLYALTTAFAAVFAIFKLAQWYDEQKTIEKETGHTGTSNTNEQAAIRPPNAK